MKLPSSIVTLLASVTICATTLSAQDPTRSLSSEQQLTLPLIPLHTQEVDPIGGDYGTWAAAADWKASFADGFRFFPYVGPDHELVDFAWRTESVRVGTTELLGATTDHSGAKTDLRYEIARGAVVEAYDIRDEGVEQSFVIAERPQGSGDLVVEGRMLGSLCPDVAASAHQELTLSHEGHEFARYGHAFAIDADGRRLAIETSSDGEQITLRVPASFVAEAAYPLTIDPLTSAVTVISGIGSSVEQTALATSPRFDQVCVAYWRQFASNDSDAFMQSRTTSFSPARMLWSDVSTNWSSRDVDIAYCEGTTRYVVSFERDFGSGNRQIRAYIHGDSNPTLNGGTTLFTSAPSGFIRSQAQIGGGRGTGEYALIVFQQAAVGSSRAEVRGLVIDTAAVNFSPDVDLHGQGVATLFLDARNPDLQPIGDTSPDPFGGNDSRWWVTWRDRLTIAGTYAIRRSRVFFNSSTPAPSITSYADVRTSSESMAEPRVAGVSNALNVFTGLSPVFVWLERNGSSLEIKSRAGTGIQASPGPVRTIVSGSSLVVGDFADDLSTFSHYALSYRLTSPANEYRIVRLGSTGAVTETTTASADNSPAALCHREVQGEPRFLVAYGRPSTALVGRSFVYPADAEVIAYGQRCQPGSVLPTLLSAGVPYAGNRYFFVQIDQATSVPILVIGFASANLDLTPFGVPCDLLVDPLNAITTSISLNGGTFGSGSISLPLPDSPLVIGDVYIQALMPGINAGTTNGLRVQIR